jgi:alpha-methylacyl-CoA racemase
MGPLAGLKIIEFGHIGPVPHCAMLLADLGATVLRIERTTPSGLGTSRPLKSDAMLRGRQAIALDLKRPEAIAFVLELTTRSDAMIEGFRPGVMERLGLGPKEVLRRNPRLVYGRMTGWGQTGPLAQAAGHDLNYIALSGALDAIGRAGQLPSPPLNLVGDFGGGSLYLALGLVSGIWHAHRTGAGQVVDAAIVDGTASLLANVQALVSAGVARAPRGHNLTDSGAYFYDVYECADGRCISIAAIEEKFLHRLFELIGLDPATMPPQSDGARWPEGRAVLAARFRMCTQAEWIELLEGTDACFAPVLSIPEVHAHPHHAARSTYISIDDVVQPAPAPRFSSSVPATPARPMSAADCDPEQALAQWFSPEELRRLDLAKALG